METEMDWETAAAAEKSNETNGGNVSNHDSSRGGPCANTRAGGRGRWAARRKQMGKGGRMPQRKGEGASRRREKHRRSGFSDGSGSDGATKVAVKYQCIGADGEGSTSGGSDDGSSDSSAEVGATDWEFQAVDNEVEVRRDMVDQRQRVVTVTRAVEALRWAVSLVRNSGLRAAVWVWRGRSREDKFGLMFVDTMNKCRSVSLGHRQLLEQRVEELEGKVKRLKRRREERGSQTEGASGARQRVQGMEAVVRDLEAQLEQLKQQRVAEVQQLERTLQDERDRGFEWEEEMDRKHRRECQELRMWAEEQVHSAQLGQLGAERLVELEAQVQQQVDVGQLMANDAFAEASRWRVQRKCVLQQEQRKLANQQRILREVVGDGSAGENAGGWQEGDSKIGEIDWRRKLRSGAMRLERGRICVRFSEFGDYSVRLEWAEQVCEELAGSVEEWIDAGVRLSYLARREEELKERCDEMWKKLEGWRQQRFRVWGLEGDPATAEQRGQQESQQRKVMAEMHSNWFVRRRTEEVREGIRAEH